MEHEKLCIFCNHFHWEGLEYTYYSTLTGGDVSGGATCRKGHFFQTVPDDNEELRALYLRASNCKDYDPPVRK
jgi:hypothetical protein